MLERFLGGQTNISRPLQKFPDDVLGVLRNRIPYFTLKTVRPMKDVINDIFILFAAKRWLSAEHDEHDDAHGPYVTLRRITSLKYLRCNIIWRTVWLIHYFVRIHFFSQTEINQLNMAIVVLLVKQEIFRLDISMTYPIGM